MTPTEAFFTVHRDLPREGPGLPEDVHWALQVANTPDRAYICDAACGPGADTATLAKARSNARIDGIDLQAHFLEAARVRCPQANFHQRDYIDLPGKYDLIWCAGAMYFKGFETVLNAWRSHLRPGGRVAFSEPSWVSEPPTPEAQTFWSAEGQVDGLPSLRSRLNDAGWRILGHRWLIGPSWEAYYDPLEARLQKLRATNPCETLTAAIAENQQEIANWEAAPDQIAYVLFVVEPA